MENNDLGTCMTFWENALSSGVGAALGSIVAGVVSIGLFFWQTKKLKKQESEDAKRKLKHELQHNTLVYSRFIEELERIKEKLDNKNRDIIVLLEYEYVLGFFSKKAYENGLFSEYLSPQEMYDFNTYLSPILDGKQASIESDIDAWNNGQIEYDIVKKTVAHEHRCLSKAKSFTNKFVSKL